MVKTIVKLKKYLGAKIELMEFSNSLEKNSMIVKENMEHYKKVLRYRDKIDDIVNNLYQTLNEAQLEGLSLDDLKQIVKA